MKFSWQTLFSSFPPLLEAAWVNLSLAVIIFLLVLAFSTGFTLLRAKKIVWLGRASAVLISFVRGTPLLIQIFICYYVLPALGLDLSPEAAGIIAITLNSTVFLAEAMRGGLATLDPGHIEAAAALGLPPRAIWQCVVLPQLFRRMIPVIVNEATIIVKGTALLSVITVVDVLRTAQQIAGGNYRPFETLLGAALIFLAINLAFSAIGNYLEARAADARV
ncbi:amino acid ABC transporter permease [Sodalis sp. RH19]|uniref:amino acid ABC transporter permease n=1 Tax=Sodalis sp. RH19 TaxID=3394334 RepID=UPI0039B6DD93